MIMVMMVVKMLVMIVMVRMRMVTRMGGGDFVRRNNTVSVG